MIDVDVRRLPNAIVLPAYPVLGLALTLAAVLPDSRPPWSGRRSAEWRLFCSTSCWPYPPEGMGFGDVKLAGLIGGMLGFLSSRPAGRRLRGHSCSVPSVASAIARPRPDAARRAVMPFGPFMFARSVSRALRRPIDAAPSSGHLLHLQPGATVDRRDLAIPFGDLMKHRQTGLTKVGFINPDGHAIGLDIGATAVRAAILSPGHARGSAVSDGARSRPGAVAQGAVSNGVVIDQAAVTAALKELWSTYKFECRNVILGSPTSSWSFAT